MSQTKVTNRSRIGCLVVIFFVPLVALVLRTGYWMILRAGWLQEKAVEQWTHQSVVEAARGDIVDKNGTVLASSSSCYSVVLLPKSLVSYQTTENRTAQKEGREPVDLENELVTNLAPILGMDESTIVNRMANKAKYEVWLKRQISDEQAAAIEKLLDPKREIRIRGVKLEEDNRRYYPMGNFASQVLGFVSVDGEGQNGIESRFNQYLTGIDGYKTLTTDVSGREIDENVDQYVAPRNGSTVVLTLDAVVQSIAEKYATLCLEEQQAQAVTAIVMEPASARILAMVNKPDYDNNNPPRSDGALLAKLSRNTAISDAYEPGSVFKIVTTASALESGATNPEVTFDCTGELVVSGEKIKCWSARPHGLQTLVQGLENSCNPVFMRLALSMGTEVFYHYIYDFGFGTKTNIQLTGESTGIIRNIKYIRDTDLARIGFGQSIAVTPLQMITAAAAAVNGGNLMKPMLVEEILDTGGNTMVDYEPTTIRRVISEETSRTMREMLLSVVDNGSGAKGQVEGYAVGGKTGTAQKYDEEGNILRNKHVASFLAFAPAEEPQFMILLVVNEPGGESEYGSVVAAPYVASMMDEILVYSNVPRSRGGQGGEDSENTMLPVVIGNSQETAVKSLERAGFRVIVEGVSGDVVGQSPEGGNYIPKGSTVMIALAVADDANDANQITLPDVTGMTPVEAYAALQAQGLKVRISGQGNQVVGLDAAPEDTLYYGDTVTLELIYVDPTPTPTPTPKPSPTPRSRRR